MVKFPKALTAESEDCMSVRCCADVSVTDRLSLLRGLKELDLKPRKRKWQVKEPKLVLLFFYGLIFFIGSPISSGKSSSAHHI